MQKKEKGGPRVDKNHRFPLRLNMDVFCESDAITFRHNLSHNLLYNLAIKFAIDHPDFIQKIEEEYGPRVNPKRGHFIYVRDWSD